MQNGTDRYLDGVNALVAGETIHLKNPEQMVGVP